MANLPDLNPAEIGIIAFWNALDHWNGNGEQSIDPTDCIGVFDEYEVYDNGIQGWKSLVSGRHFNARVKTDGWMVAWIDRTNTFAYPSKTSGEFGEDAHKGYYDILYNWLSSGSNISSSQTTLSYLISQLYNALSNKGDFNYSDADVGHYCYEYPDATVITLISLCRSGSNKAGYVQYTEGTTLYYAAVTGAAFYYYSSPPYVKFDDNLLAQAPMDQARYGVADILAEGWMPEPLIDRQLYVKASGNNYNHAHGSIIIIWG